MRIESIRTVIFDCDGVLFDTARSNRAYYNRILSQFNRPDMTPEQFAYVHMHTVDDALAHLFPEPAALEAARSFRKTLSYSAFFAYMEMEPNLLPLLAKLRPRYRTAIATNRSDTMKPLLETFDLAARFDLIVTALDVPRPKPHPDELIKALEFFRLHHDEAIYIGDSPLDEQAAAAASIPFVAFQNPGLAADAHISSLKEIETLLGIG